MMRRAFWVIVFLLLFLGGCVGKGAHAVEQGEIRNIIYSIESKVDGTYFVWMTNDDVGAYCTMDKAIYDQAKSILEDETRIPKVFLGYESLNRGTKERPATLSNAFGTEGCSHSEATVYVITYIRRVNDELLTAVPTPE